MDLRKENMSVNLDNIDWLFIIGLLLIAVYLDEIYEWKMLTDFWCWDFLAESQLQKVAVINII